MQTYPIVTCTEFKIAQRDDTLIERDAYPVQLPVHGPYNVIAIHSGLSLDDIYIYFERFN